MGIGLAAIGMAAIVASTRWFAPAYFGTVVGVILGVSYVGHLASTLPMAQISAAIGWRSTLHRRHDRHRGARRRGRAADPRCAAASPVS